MKVWTREVGEDQDDLEDRLPVPSFLSCQSGTRKVEHSVSLVAHEDGSGGTQMKLLLRYNLCDTVIMVTKLNFFFSV
jgi:hypothetical protein